MTGCIACYSTGDSTSVVSRTVGSVRISCNGRSQYVCVFYFTCSKLCQLCCFTTSVVLVTFALFSVVLQASVQMCYVLLREIHTLRFYYIRLYTGTRVHMSGLLPVTLVVFLKTF